MSSHPHGDCQCDGPCACSTRRAPGPAAYRVQREGRPLRVCTQCIHASDERVETLATLAEIPLYLAYDPLGGHVLSRRLRLRNHAPTTLN